VTGGAAGAGAGGAAGAAGVRLGRLRSGELLAAAGALALVVLLSLRWFEPRVPVRVVESAGRLLGGEPSTTGWAALGVPVVALLVAVVLAALALAATTAAGGMLARAVGAAVIAASLATLALPVLALRVALLQPGLGLGLPNDLVEARPVAYLGVAACAAIAAGAWRALADERTGAAESRYMPPDPRPAPPPA
jgi:hypothetical protein